MPMTMRLQWISAYLNLVTLLQWRRQYVFAENELIDDNNDCACNKTNMWLDVSVLFESSNVMTSDEIQEISGTLLAVFSQMTISQTLQQASHVAVNTFAPADITTDLSTYSTGDELISRFLTLNSNMTATNTLAAAQQSIILFDGPGRRTYARKVLMLVLSSVSVGSSEDLHSLATQFKANYGVLIVINYVPRFLTQVPGICELSSPGMCFIVNAANRDDVIQDIVNSLCSANCFCKRNDYQYISGTEAQPIEHGPCIHIVGAPTSWGVAQLICKTQNSLLTQIFDQAKMDWITNLVINVIGSAQTFVGLKYDATLSPADWYWETQNGFAQISSPADTFWNSGSPNHTLGDCVMLQQAGGFSLKFTSTDCNNVNLKYTCQYDTCDTNNFCPTALGPQETAEMHLLPHQYKKLKFL